MKIKGIQAWESTCNIERNVGAHIYKILLVFVPYQPRVKGMPEKS